MCTSVPQIADFFTLISTSFGPISGTGTRSIQRPSSGFDLTSAFIMFVIIASTKPSLGLAPHPAAATFSPSPRGEGTCGNLPSPLLRAVKHVPSPRLRGEG